MWSRLTSETTGRKLKKLKERQDSCHELPTELCIFWFLAPVWEDCLNRIISSVPWPLRSCFCLLIHQDLSYLNNFWEMCVPRALLSKRYCGCLVPPPASPGHLATPIPTSFSWWETWLQGKDKKWMAILGFTNYKGGDMQSHIHAGIHKQLLSQLEVLGELLSTLHLWKMRSWAKECSHCVTPAFS